MKGLNDLALEPQYAGNNFDGEKAIIDALKDAYKYEPDAGPNQSSFVNRVVEKLWSGAKEIPWSDVKLRAATDPSWVWHHPRVLDEVRDEMVRRDQWRNIGNGFVQRGPFPPPRPVPQVQLLDRNDNTGEVTLRIKPLNGDTVYVQKMDGASPGAREQIQSYDIKTSDLRLVFTAVNAAEGVEGDIQEWKNTINLKYRLSGAPGELTCELRALPAGTIRYTTDGASPANGGHVYSEPFRVPAGCTVILAQAGAEGITSGLLRIEVPKDGRDDGGEVWRVNLTRPATWRKYQKLDATSEVFTFLDQVISNGATLGGARIVAQRAIVGQN